MCYKGLEYNVFGSNLIFTGHEKGHVKVWKLLFDKAHSNPWRVSLEVTLKQSEPSSAISCLYFPG